MKIINNSRSDVTFGYNAALNNKLVKVLTADPSPHNNALLMHNTLCNKLEKDLDVQTKFRPHDEDGCYDEETDKFIGYFVDLKMKLAEQINDRFPQLGFARNEAKQYEKEMNGDEFHWKDELVTVLNEVADEVTFKISMK